MRWKRNTRVDKQPDASKGNAPKPGRATQNGFDNGKEPPLQTRPRCFNRPFLRYVSERAWEGPEDRHENDVARSRVSEAAKTSPAATQLGEISQHHGCRPHTESRTVASHSIGDGRPVLHGMEAVIRMASRPMGLAAAGGSRAGPPGAGRMDDCETTAPSGGYKE